MSADVPVFTAIVDVHPDPGDDEGGMTAARPDDFGVPIPDEFLQRFDAWYRQLPVFFDDATPDMDSINRTGRHLAEDLAIIIGQPVAYDLPFVRPGNDGRCRCQVHRQR